MHGSWLTCSANLGSDNLVIKKKCTHAFKFYLISQFNPITTTFMWNNVKKISYFSLHYSFLPLTKYDWAFIKPFLHPQKNIRHIIHWGSISGRADVGSVSPSPSSTDLNAMKTSVSSESGILPVCLTFWCMSFTSSGCTKLLMNLNMTFCSYWNRLRNDCQWVDKTFLLFLLTYKL